MDAREVLAALRLEDGRRWLDAAHDFQRRDLLEVLEGDCPYHFLTRARGASKTTDLAAGALAVLVSATGPLRSYWLAADRDQARLCVDAISGFLARSPVLAQSVAVQAYRVVGPAGAVLEILAADAPSAWGLSPDFIFIDEISNWTDTDAAKRLWFAMSTAAAKRANCRMVVLTTAGSPDHFACLEVLEPAKRSKLWRVSERPGPAPWMSEERLEEQRERLPAAVFDQLFENRWTAASGSFLAPDAVDRAFMLDGPAEAEQRHFYFAALDVGSVNDATAFAIGHRDGARVLLDRMVVWRGSRRRPVSFAEVEETIVHAHGVYRFAMTADPWQSLDLSQRLRARRVPVVEFNFTQPSKQRLAATLLSLLNGGNLALYQADGLRKELLALRLVQTSSGLWAFDHRPGGHDDQAVALSMMAVAALEGPGPAQPLNHRVGPEPFELSLGISLPGEGAMAANPQGRGLTPPDGWGYGTDRGIRNQRF
jgi:Terminase large subunit, ATPase domain